MKKILFFPLCILIFSFITWVPAMFVAAGTLGPSHEVGTAGFVLKLTVLISLIPSCWAVRRIF